MDARSRPRAAPLAGKGLAGADRPGASARVGSVRRRSEPGYGGTTVKLTWVGAPAAVSETTVTRADAPRLLEYWRHPVGTRTLGGGTRLTLWHNIDRRFISMGRRRLAHLLRRSGSPSRGQPIGRIVGPEAMKFGGWQRLNAEYAKQFGIETPRLAASGGSEVVNRESP